MHTSTSDEIPNLLLARPGVGSPQRQLAAVADGYRVVSDIKPDVIVRPAFDDDAVPAGVFQHGGKSPPEITAGIPSNGKGLCGGQMTAISGATWAG